VCRFVLRGVNCSLDSPNSNFLQVLRLAIPDDFHNITLTVVEAFLVLTSLLYILYEWFGSQLTFPIILQQNELRMLFLLTPQCLYIIYVQDLVLTVPDGHNRSDGRFWPVDLCCAVVGRKSPSLRLVSMRSDTVLPQ
jgi:hypothetical protein